VNGLTQNENEGSGQLLLELCLTIIANFAVLGDIEKELDKLAREEAALDRANIAINARIALENILGKTKKVRISEWTADPRLQHFPIKRDAAWIIEKETDSETVSVPLQYGTGPAPADLYNTEGLKHHDRAIYSLINKGLWDKAGWKGVGYIQSRYPYHPPGMSLLFSNREVGRLIFSQLRAKFKDSRYRDEKDLLRVSIITGIEQDKPNNYRVLLSVNPQAEPGRNFKQSIVVSRLHTLEPSTSENLDNFLTDFEENQAHCILPAFQANASVPPSVFIDLAILKHVVNVRPAWTIGENDPDIYAIRPADKVIIPPDVKDAPVLAALKQQGELRDRKKEL